MASPFLPSGKLVSLGVMCAQCTLRLGPSLVLAPFGLLPFCYFFGCRHLLLRTEPVATSPRSYPSTHPKVYPGLDENTFDLSARMNLANVTFKTEQFRTAAVDKGVVQLHGQELQCEPRGFRTNR